MMAKAMAALTKAVGAVLLLAAIVAVSRLDSGLSGFFFFPAQADDYKLLSFSMTRDFLAYPRPVSTVIKGFLSSLGYDGFTSALHLLTAVYGILVLAFLSILFEVRLRFVSILFLGAMLIASPFLVRYYTYLGLNTNLTSGVFGAAALVCFVTAMKRRSVWTWIAGLVLVAVSAFCKEDFVLPSLVLLAGALIFKRTLVPELDRSKGTLIALVSVLGILAASLIYNNLTGNPTTTGKGPYAVSLAPTDILESYWFYLLKDRYTAIILGAALLVGIVRLVWSGQRRAFAVRSLVALGIVLAMVLPYSLLPNHRFAYYSFMWHVWICAFLVVAIAGPLSGVSTRWRRWSGYAAGGIGVLAIALATSQLRTSVKNWVRYHSDINRNILASLEEMRPELSGEQRVGVFMPPRLSPWTKHNSRYLARKRGFDNQWVVFLEPKQVGTFLPGGRTKLGAVEVRLVESVCDDPELRIMRFEKTGRASLASSCSALLPPKANGS